MDRRELLRLLAASPFPVLLGASPAALEQAVRVAHASVADPGRYQARFFTPAEWETVRLLAELIIPRDERSGSAGDAMVPEFIDTLLAEGEEAQQTALRGGLAWLDRECRSRWENPFRMLSVSRQTTMLDTIAWPARAHPAMSQGVAFFTRFRDLVAAGFWSSRIGVDDLGYQGNTFVAQWTGCPDPQLRKLGVRP